MKRFMMGLLVGFTVAAGVAWAASGRVQIGPPALYPWHGEGARPGLYYHRATTRTDVIPFFFYECKRLGAVSVTPPKP